jgi:hypothetical protein
MAQLGPNAEAPWLRDILRQVGANYSQAKLDEIADSLVARAVDSRGEAPGSPASARAFEAINALGDAGRGSELAGQPYAGALDRLIAVEQRASERAIRSHALAVMLNVTSDRGRAIDYLRHVAESNEATAYDAVEMLIADANGSSWGGIKASPSQQEQTVSALKALAARQQVTTEPARTILVLWVALHGSDQH